MERKRKNAKQIVLHWPADGKKMDQAGKGAENACSSRKKRVKSVKRNQLEFL